MLGSKNDHINLVMNTVSKSCSLSEFDRKLSRKLHLRFYVVELPPAEDMPQGQIYNLLGGSEVIKMWRPL